MDLLLDIGNTNVKWALWDGRKLGRVSTCAHRKGGLVQLAVQWRVLPRPDRILAANVAGSHVGKELETLTQRLWRSGPEFVKTRKNARGVTIAYEQPERLGVDRWLELLAVYHLHTCPALVADCGTAVTLDAIGAAGQHLGGLIVPGLSMMWHCLFECTRIPAVSSEECNELLGRDTGQCVSAGSAQAVAGLIERVSRHLGAKYAWDVQIILSGSDAPRIAGLLGPETTYQPDLVLQGLALLTD